MVADQRPGWEGAMRFQPKSPVAEKAQKAPNADWLNNFHVAVLMAVEQLQGQGQPVTIILVIDRRRRLQFKKFFLPELIFDHRTIVPSNWLPRVRARFWYRLSRS